MRCLVTGATGFLGTNVVVELVKAGWQVRASGMHGSDTRYLDDLGVEIRLADITRPEEVDRLVRGCEVVFNIAGDTSFWKRTVERQRRINVDGAVNVARACVRNGVRRLVHTSSVDTLGYNPDGVTDETWTDFNFAGMGYHYAESKREGEHQVLAFGQQGLDVVVIYPGFLIGPWDYTLQAGRLFFDLRDGKMPLVPSGGASFAHAAEVARAHVAAARVSRPGEGYICAGINDSFRHLAAEIARIIGAKPPSLVAPRWLLVLYGMIAETTARFTGRPPAMNPGQARYMSIRAAYSSAKAERELAYRVAPLSEQVHDALTWYREHGLWTT